ncbi:alpha/beta fold hydrolase [Hoeflea poritis]|uniref:Alpha/beta fold hydrolase n=1 Tax=Hoeflea poritis TaxID=2993659 RepID=A0ABT4VHD9_9HYPH|nr:alpha/beta fold hydrolase [Hoeflea poritis]MDA4844114.1 alpha/beta fold hydrolase [Hoeflea poritis]
MDWIIGLILLGGLAIALGWFIAGFREKPLTNEERRANAPGQTVSLEAGDLYYTRRGPKDGPVVVMVHGFSTPQFVYEQNAAALAEAGYHVVLFDHFGRGWSSRPKARYDAEFFDRELAGLLNALGLNEPIGLVGYSMGGIISAEFAARHPERLSALVLLAPAGLALEPFLGRTFGRLLLIPLLGDWLWRICGRAVLLGDPQIKDHPADDSRCMQGDDTEQMRYRGYFPAVLQTWRHLPMRNRDDVFAAASKVVPMMALFGDCDQVIGLESAARLKRAAPHARVEIMEGGTHGLLYEMHDTVNPILIDFLRQEAS